MTVMWQLEDLVTSDTYVLPRNPNVMTSLLPKKAIEAIPDTVRTQVGRARQGFPPPTEFSFGGNIKTKVHYDELLSWSKRTSVVRITDHLARTFDVIFVAFQVDEKPFSRRSQWRFTYTMECLLLAASEVLA